MLILISIAVQLVLYFLLRPIIYNGVRHYAFLLPQLVILAVIGYQIVQKKYPRLNTFFIGAISINIILIAVFYARGYPYIYPFFNYVVKSIPGLEQQFDFDYWASSDKEALMWLKNHLPANANPPHIYMCSKSMSLNYYLPEAIDSNDDISKADYIVCYENQKLEEIKKQIDGEVLFTVERMGRVYNTIYKPSR